MAQARLSRAWDDVQPYYSVGQGVDVVATAQYGSTGFYWYRFTNNAGKDEQYQFSYQLPHRWQYATGAEFHLHVVPSANGSAGNNTVVFQVAYQWVNIGSAYSTTTNTSASAAFVVGSAGANVHTLWEFPEISGSGKTLSSDLVIILTRLSKTSATDDYTGDVWLRYTDIHVQIDKLGSAAEVTD